MAFWNAFLNKKNGRQKHQILCEVNDIFDKKLLPAIQTGQISEIQQLLIKLSNFPLKTIASTIHAKIVALDTPTILEFAKMISKIPDEKFVANIFSHIAITNPQDRIWIWIGELLLQHRRHPFLGKEILHTIWDVMQNVLGLKVKSAIASLLHGKKPKDPKDLAYIRGTITIPLFRFFVRLVLHHNPEVRRYTMLMLYNVQEHDSKIIPILAKALQDPKAEVCKAAAHALSKIGPKSLPWLRKILVASSSRVQISIVWILGNWPKESLEILPELIDCLNTNDDKLYKSLEWALSNMGDSVIPLLIKKIQEEKEPIFLSNLVKVFGFLKPTLTPEIDLLLRKLAEHPSILVRSAAFVAISRIGIDAKYLWLNGLEDKDENICIASLQALYQYIYPVPEALHRIFFLAQSDNPEIREAVVRLLGKINREKYDLQNDVAPQNDIINGESGAKTQKIFSEAQNIDIAAILIQFLDDENPNVQKAAMIALSTEQNHAKKIVPKIIDIAKKYSTEEIQLTVLATLKELGRAAENVDFDWVLEMLKIPGQVQLATLGFLVQLKELSSPAIPHLLPLLLEKDVKTLSKVSDVFVAIGPNCSRHLVTLGTKVPVEIRFLITKILIRMGPELIPEMIQMLVGSSANRRRIAVDVLGGLGEAAIPKLVSLMDCDDFWVRRAIARSLEKNGRAAATYLLRMLQEQSNSNMSYIDPELLSMAIEVLKKMKQKALPLLLPFVSDKNTRLSQLTIQALKMVNPDYQNCIPDILPFLEHSNSLVRRAVLWCLEKIENTSPEILSLLEKVQEMDSDPEVRAIAKQSLSTLISIKESGPAQQHSQMQD